HDRTNRRRALVDLGTAAAERAPHLRRVHLHAVRNGQAVRVSGRHHAGRWHGARRVAGWPGLHPGVVRGRVTPRRAVHPSRRLSAGRRDGGGLFHRPRVARFLDGAQSGHARGDLLLRVAVPLGRRRRPVEPPRAGRPLATDPDTTTGPPPSGGIAARWGAIAARGGAPAVFPPGVGVTCPPRRPPARGVRGAYGTRHIRWRTSPTFRFTPSEPPFRNSS